ncbi:hypothetical protein VB773_22850 [Haloarculaceae archaeon H-GB2-1]|nr:hypothetical protein [Haloarculaceae archaeon H-GB1-1]MEA5389601.1 hypothetical protein [Haloarculaceae archaeon H-GB11]MEA5410134.1 hypothetical protein [Haloarculaceae archaeon H-GB2-1]
MVSVEVLLEDEGANALVGWFAIGTMLLVAGLSVRWTAYLWGCFAVVTAVTAALPPIATRDWKCMVPWSLLVAAAAALLAGAVWPVVEMASFVVITLLAVLVVAEVVAFTPVEMSVRFAVAFAVLTALAVEAVWAVGQYYSDLWWETTFLQSQTELQWDFVLVTVVALVIGSIVRWLGYFETPGGSSA